MGETPAKKRLLNKKNKCTKTIENQDNGDVVFQKKTPVKTNPKRGRKPLLPPL